MVNVKSNYDPDVDRIKLELEYSDDYDPKLILKESEAAVAWIARFISTAGQVSPTEFLRGVISDIEDGYDIVDPITVREDDKVEQKEE